LVGQYAVDRALIGRDAIWSGQQRCRGRRHQPAVGANVGPHIAIDLRPYAEQGTVAPGGDLDLAVYRTRVIGRLQVLAAVFDPLYRLANLDGRKRNQKVLRIKLPTDTKTAAHIGLNEVDLVLRHIEHRGEDSAIEMRHLGGTPDAQLPAASVVTRHDT